MVRAEDGTEFTTLAQAEATECRACGKRLEFENADQKETPGVVATATHCDTLYTIGEPTHYVLSAGPVPEEKPKATATTSTTTSASGTQRGKK